MKCPHFRRLKALPNYIGHPLLLLVTRYQPGLFMVMCYNPLQPIIIYPNDILYKNLLSLQFQLIVRDYNYLFFNK